MKIYKNNRKIKHLYVIIEEILIISFFYENLDIVEYEGPSTETADDQAHGRPHVVREPLHR